jgi:hypothetical protein
LKARSFIFYAIEARAVLVSSRAATSIPDFILWLVVGKKQFVSFADPKGLRNLTGGIIKSEDSVL